jgi:hypothetical protein
MSADVILGFLAGVCIGLVVVVAPVGFLRSLLVNGDSKQSRNGAKTAKQKWWLR